MEKQIILLWVSICIINYALWTVHNSLVSIHESLASIRAERALHP